MSPKNLEMSVEITRAFVCMLIICLGPLHFMPCFWDFKMSFSGSSSPHASQKYSAQRVFLCIIQYAWSRAQATNRLVRDKGYCYSKSSPKQTAQACTSSQQPLLSIHGSCSTIAGEQTPFPCSSPWQAWSLPGCQEVGFQKHSWEDRFFSASAAEGVWVCRRAPKEDERNWGLL